MPLIASRARATLARTGRRSRARSVGAAGGVAIMSALAAVTGTSNAGAAILAAAFRVHSLTAQAAAPVNILTTPTRVSHTTDGAVGYREIGTGSPLLLIMGYAGSLDNWAPDFVDELAQAHTVVMLDNSGVGETSRVPGTLTIDAMANQTSALLTSLHLGPVSVLGWSMGGMTAQALAVLHPSQVSKLVLAATQVGNGKARPVPASAAAELASPDPGLCSLRSSHPGKRQLSGRTGSAYLPTPTSTPLRRACYWLKAWRSPSGSRARIRPAGRSHKSASPRSSPTGPWTPSTRSKTPACWPLRSKAPRYTSIPTPGTRSCSRTIRSSSARSMLFWADRANCGSATGRGYHRHPRCSGLDVREGS